MGKRFSNLLREQQNRIALFKKRYELYTKWEKLCSNIQRLEFFCTEKFKELKLENEKKSDMEIIQDKMMFIAQGLSILLDFTKIRIYVKEKEDDMNKNLIRYRETTLEEPLAGGEKDILFFDYDLPTYDIHEWISI